MNKRLFLCLFSLAPFSVVSAIIPLSNQKKTIIQLAHQKKEMLRLIKKLPNYRRARSTSFTKPNYISLSIQLHRPGKPILLLLKDGTRCMLEKQKITILKKKLFYMEGRDSTGKLFRRLETNKAIWISFYHKSNKFVTNPIEHFKKEPLCADKIIFKNGTTFMRSFLKGQYLFTIKADNLEIRYSRNGTLSFNDTATKLLFYNYAYQQKKAEAFLKTIFKDFPNTLFTEVTRHCLKRKICLSNRAQLVTAVLNYFRNKTGVPPIQHDNRLDNTAKDHAAFLAASFRSGLNINPHLEVRGGFKYSGNSIAERVQKRGYTNSCIELIGYNANPISDITDWVNSIYHRIPLLAKICHHAGYGKAVISNSGLAGISVLLIGATPTTPKKIYIFPNGIKIDTAWNGLEYPIAIPPKTNLYGYPITIALPQGNKIAKKIQLTSHQGKAVKFHSIKQTIHTQGTYITIVPHNPFAYNNTYTLSFQVQTKKGPLLIRKKISTRPKPKLLKLYELLRP